MGITLKKAIELLPQIPLPLKTAEDHDNFAALRLSIEGLKRIQNARDMGKTVSAALLPGEVWVES